MTVQGSNLHNILRTYNKQIKYSKVSENRTADSSKNLDKVSLSPDAKKLMFLSNIAADGGIKSKSTLNKIEQKLSDIDFKHVTDEELENIKKNLIEEFS